MTDFSQAARDYVSTHAATLPDQPLVYDPVRPGIARLNKMERGYVMLQSAHRGALQQLLQVAVDWVKTHPLQAKIRWVQNVDALEY